MTRGRQKNIDRQINPEEIEKIKALLRNEDEDAIEKDLKELLKQRRQKIHRQVATMENRNKHLLMWSVVVIIMVLVVGFWLFKFNEIISRPTAVANYDIKQIDFEKTKEELSATMEKVKAGLEEIKKEAQKLEEEKTDKAIDSEPDMKEVNQ